mmetsp:Transcript_39190/g.104050  ORF Transcript_39190/g.104050 Transcript_39190/m.104050 type:complete len:343 (-) Transcript_39190:114-1142(-)
MVHPPFLPGVLALRAAPGCAQQCARDSGIYAIPVSCETHPRDHLHSHGSDLRAHLAVTGQSKPKYPPKPLDPMSGGPPPPPGCPVQSLVLRGSAALQPQDLLRKHPPVDSCRMSAPEPEGLGQRRQLSAVRDIRGSQVPKCSTLWSPPIPLDPMSSGPPPPPARRVHSVVLRASAALQAQDLLRRYPPVDSCRKAAPEPEGLGQRRRLCDVLRDIRRSRVPKSSTLSPLEVSHQTPPPPEVVWTAVSLERSLGRIVPEPPAPHERRRDDVVGAHLSPTLALGDDPEPPAVRSPRRHVVVCPCVSPVGMCLPLTSQAIPRQLPNPSYRTLATELPDDAVSHGP